MHRVNTRFNKTLSHKIYNIYKSIHFKLCIILLNRKTLQKGKKKIHLQSFLCVTQWPTRQSGIKRNTWPSSANATEGKQRKHWQETTSGTAPIYCAVKIIINNWLNTGCEKFNILWPMISAFWYIVPSRIRNRNKVPVPSRNKE